jgi:thiol-disulfide isomerase/thioredoxin
MATRHRSKKQKNRTYRNQSKVIIGKVYADWCGHCQHLVPEWNTMRKNVKGRVIVMDIRETVPAKKGGISLTNLKVEGFPTIFKTKNGGATFEYYGGLRQSAELTEWALKP